MRVSNRLAVPQIRPMPRGRHEERRMHLLAELTHSTADIPSRILQTRILFAGSLVVAILLTSAGYLSTRPTTDPFTVGCYDALDQNSDTMVLPFKGNGNLQAAELCAKEWMAQGHSVPDSLVTCVVSGGGLGVPEHVAYGWRIQSFNATNSPSLSAGVCQPKVLRGRPLRLSAAAWRSAAL